MKEPMPLPYPKEIMSKLSPSDRLLFDIGYSYALLEQIRVILGDIAACEDYPVEVKELLEAIVDFQTNRLLLRNTIYGNAEAALATDRRLAAFEKIYPKLIEYLKSQTDEVYSGTQWVKVLKCPARALLRELGELA